MKINTKKTKKILIITFLIFGLLVLGLFSFRNIILDQVITKIKNKVKTQYDCNFSIKKASFEGINGLEFTDVVLAPIDKDTLFKIKEIKTSINLMKLIVGDIQLGRLHMNDGYLQLTRKGDVKNFDAFLKKDELEEDDDDEKNYAKYAYKVISKVLDLVPTDLNVKNLVFKGNDNGKKAQIKINSLTLVDKKIDANINVVTNTFSQNWKIKGIADPRNKSGDVQLYNMSPEPVKLPYFDQAYHLLTTFDSIRLNVQNIEKNSDELHINGFASVKNLKINHKKIARNDVVINKARFDYRFVLGTDYVSIDSSSAVQFNKIKFHPYVSYQNGQSKIYTLKVNIPKMTSQDFINSLPDGLFANIKGMEAAGSFDYKLHFKFDKDNPEDLVFDSKLNKENLKITKYGKADLTKLNGSFQYRAVIKDVMQRPIYVGSSNPNYVTMDQMSPYLPKCVLTTEDPKFYNHKGFDEDAFKLSIVKNYKNKEFSRGASTISMQLIKNVFLIREKTLSRKLEEILLTYMLENSRIVSKRRMLEVYFNIIEWGPNVYGIGEASEFYFQKKPIDLTLSECMYLAKIIPSPTKFMYQFNSEGNLKDHVFKTKNYYQNLMLRRGLIVAEDTIGQNTPFTISGRSREYLRIVEKDSIAVDSVVSVVPGLKN